MTVYVDPPKCKPTRQNMPGQLLEAGQSFTCPTCGRKWLSTIKISFGGRPICDWVCTSAPGAPGLPEQVTALTTQVTDLTTQLAVLTARFPLLKTQHIARADGVAVALNGSIDVTFTWPTPFTDANYEYEAPLPPTLIGKVTVTQKTKTAAALTLTLKSNSLAVSAFTWIATATKVG